jgi:hypothetical protein
LADFGFGQRIERQGEVGMGMNIDKPRRQDASIRFTGMLTRPPTIIASPTVMANSIYNGWCFEDLWLESDHPYSGL